MHLRSMALLSLILSAAAGAATTNVVVRPAPAPSSELAPADPVEQQYQKVLEEDDAAHAEVDAWIRENEAFRAQGADFSGVTLNPRIEQRFRPVRAAYEDFLTRHPDHVRARLAYGSFLNGVGDDEAALAQWEKARDLDPKSAAAWNNLADYHSRHGPTPRAFECLDKAVELKPDEPVYRRNLATLVFLYRKEAQTHYRLADDQAVLRRAIELYRTARRLDPENFTLATDLAQVYYDLQPAPASDAAQARIARDKLGEETMKAWLEARRLARNDLDREGVAIHLARVCIIYGRVEQARQYLAEIKNPSLAAARQTLEKNLERSVKGETIPPADQ